MARYITDLHMVPNNTEVIVQNHMLEDIRAVFNSEKNSGAGAWIDIDGNEIDGVFCWREITENDLNPVRKIVRIVNSDKYAGRLGTLVKVERPLSRIILIPTLEDPEETEIKLPPYIGDYEHLWPGQPGHPDTK